MKRIALWLGSTASALVLLLSYHTSTSSSGGGTPTATAAAAGIVSTTTGTTAPSATPTTSSAPTTPTTAPSATPATPATKIVVVNGATVSTRYGDVQVQITVTGTRITKAVAISYSTEGRDGEINAYAVPVLQQETATAQSASIDTVSGATYTSEGYISSLQSALDAAHL